MLCRQPRRAELRATSGIDLDFFVRASRRAIVETLPVLLRLRLTVPSDPAKQTSDDQEFLVNTQDIVENFRREAMYEGQRKLFLRQLRRRFGAEVDAETERRVAAAPDEQLEVWAERVLSASTLTEILAD